MPTLTTCLWFDGTALDAAEFYVSLFPNSEITDTFHLPDGSVLTVNWTLDGSPFMAINGGPQFPHTEAYSVFLGCDDQAEADHYWDALLGDGGEPSQCGWLRDRFGISWQVVPAGLHELLGDPEPARAAAAHDAMMQMSRLDLSAMRAAADAASAG
jgi:predicted 3-demethylubiquinone-9 3-methyltransferase (glyoxalase superfamily)